MQLQTALFHTINTMDSAMDDETNKCESNVIVVFCKQCICATKRNNIIHHSCSNYVYGNEGFISIRYDIPLWQIGRCANMKATLLRGDFRLFHNAFIYDRPHNKCLLIIWDIYSLRPRQACILQRAEELQ